MVRGQLPKAYLRIDPDLDAKHPDLLAEFIRLLCAANRQPRRGWFKTRAIVEGLLGRATTKRLIERGDLLADGTEWAVDGWAKWQEGNLDVAERMRIIRAERDAKPRTNGAQKAHIPSTEGAQMVAPTSEASGNKASIPQPPAPYDTDDLEVLADGLLGHPATPRQLGAVRDLSRKVGKAHAVDVLRHWLRQPEIDDPFGSALAQLQTEADVKGKRGRSQFAYMDEPA